MAVPWVRFTENALVPKIMLQFQNGDTFQHQGDSAGIFMYSAGIFETFVKKILCPRASPMWTVNTSLTPSPTYMFNVNARKVMLKDKLWLDYLPEQKWEGER